MDLLLGFLCVTIVFFVFLEYENQFFQTNQDSLERWERQKNALSRFDALVKLRNEKNPILGSAKIHAQKKRVQSNQLDLELLHQIKTTQTTESVFFRQLKLFFFNHTVETIIDSMENAQTCTIVERIVLVENKKAILWGEVCER